MTHLIFGTNYLTQFSAVLLFWIAFILTRSFGETLGDFLTKPHEKGGLNFGTIGSSIVLGSILGVCILFTTLQQRKLAVVRPSKQE